MYKLRFLTRLEVGLRPETIGASVPFGDLSVDVVGAWTRDGRVPSWVLLDVDLQELLTRHAELEAT